MLPYNFSHLFTESLRAGDAKYIRMAKPELLNNLEREGRELVLEQHALYGTLPTLIVAKKHPATALLISEEHKGEPYEAVAQSALDQILTRWVRHAVREFDGAVNPRTRVDLSILQKVIDTARMAMPDEVSMTLMDADIDSLFSQSDLQNALHFGYSGIDKAAAGLMPGEVAVMTARTGNGKSLFCCHVATKWIKEGKRVLFVSCEMPPAQLLHRIYGILGSFNPKAFRMVEGRAILDAAMPRVHDEMNAVRAAGGNVLFLSKTVTMDSIKNEVAKSKPDAVIIDGIYLLTPGGLQAGAQDWQRVKAVSNDIKASIALDKGLPVLTTTQLKRGADSDLYSLEDIAYSDAIGQDGDLVLAASRDPGVSHTLNVGVIKNRNGETFGGSRLEVDWDTMTMTESPLLTRTLRLGEDDAPAD